MKKIVMILDQIQAGAGGKEKSNIPPAGKSSPLGPGVMMDPFLNESKVIATLFCGDEFFVNNEEEVTSKMIAMVKKLSPDVVICGPSFNYENFSKMSAILSKNINDKTYIPAFAAMSEENIDVINEYKNDICIVKTPKKGGIGLNDSLNNICKLAKAMANKEDITLMKEEFCY
ncbi:glycine/betaine/sarcosine/D-proline family reductase selenoprotein B [Clostridioides difficile]|nr:glycine/betaine/sarcosine/D-proline family reductase selenoprotein B [Clostridioides difficile]EGT4222586.1 glycine/betaine/sarcosine/D-proline family reductase selenoprotein B [Clostridioides difficile]